MSCRQLISLVGMPLASTAGLQIMRAKCRAIAASFVTDLFLIYEGNDYLEIPYEKERRRHTRNYGVMSYRP
jgi:hypothetical protein